MVEGVTSLYFTNVRNEPRDNATVLSLHITFCHCIKSQFRYTGYLFISLPRLRKMPVTCPLHLQYAVQRIEVQYQLTPKKQILVSKSLLGNARGNDDVRV